MPEQITKTIQRMLAPGHYASVDVSETKEKGVAICLLTVEDSKPSSIQYFHQPFPAKFLSDITKEKVEKMVNLWPEQLRSATCYSVDSPLRFARQDGGRLIDRQEQWEKFGFGDYLNSPPKEAPTQAKAQEKGKRWIAIGKWFAEVLSAFCDKVFEVYPTSTFNALHLWQGADINITDWFAEEPDKYSVILDDGLQDLSLRFLERLRTCTKYGEMRTKFRKLSYWPYPDLWDAFGGAVTSMLYCSQLTENVEATEAPDEGRIVVPMRRSTLQSRGLLSS